MKGREGEREIDDAGEQGDAKASSAQPYEYLRVMILNRQGYSLEKYL